jgi:hypothetical protein
MHAWICSSNFVGNIIAADVILSKICYYQPTLKAYIKYALLMLMEDACLERTAYLLSKAVDFVHENEVLGSLLRAPAPWQSPSLGNGAISESPQMAILQLSTLLLITLTQVYRLSLPWVQVCFLPVILSFSPLALGDVDIEDGEAENDKAAREFGWREPWLKRL